MRTNPEKGLNTDPRWREVTWNEAVDSFAEKVRRIKMDPAGYDPQKIVIATFDYWALYFTVQLAWARALGVKNGPIGAACFCGNNVHPPALLNLGTFEITPDAKYAKYVLLIGAQTGSMVNYDTMNVARDIAAKRPGEVKVVVVDPVCAFAASRAEEWVPIRPGTDGAFILAVLNLLLNEYSIYDADFLRKRTNAPYLVGEDGLYVRDRGTGKPLVWDTGEGRARPFDDPVNEFALEGDYVVDGGECRPAFVALKEHVTRYTPEYASEITTIPVETIRRIAKELGESAHIGETITVDGVELPYRPVSVIWFRGTSAHRNSFATGLAGMLLSTILGAIQVPGAVNGHPHVPEYVTEEGLMAIPETKVQWKGSYPPRKVRRPGRLDVYELFPVASYSTPMIIPALVHPERFGLPKGFGPELMILYRDNPVRNTVSPELVVEALRKVPFVVAFAEEMDETCRLADLVFPDLHYLERLAESIYTRVDEPGYWYGAKPAVKPPFDPPYDGMVSNAEIFLKVAEQAGFLSEVYSTLNDIWNLKETRYALDPAGKYSYNELIDRRLKSWLGPEKGIDWFLQPQGGLLVWKPKVEERFKGAFRKARVHLYYEFMLRAGSDLKNRVADLGISWNTSDYQALPEWKPCQAYEKKGGEFDLFVVNAKTPTQTHGFVSRNPLLKELSRSNALDYALINPETARARGIGEEDEIWLETVKGQRIRAAAKLSERVHPEVIGTLQHRIEKGADFNALLTMDEDRIDFVGCAVDSCVLVKVYKASEPTGSEPANELPLPHP